MTEPLPKDLAANPILSRWIRVDPAGGIDVRVGKVELGQGILTALAQLAADELGADLAGSGCGRPTRPRARTRG